MRSILLFFFILSPGKQLYGSLSIEELKSYKKVIRTSEANNPIVLDAYLALIDEYIATKNWSQLMEVAQTFTYLYPHHPDMDKVLCYLGVSFFHVGGVVAMEQAKQRLELLRSKYKNSSYLELGITDKIDDRLARQELSIAEHYFYQGNWVATINRVQYIKEHYPNSTAIPQAQTLMQKSLDAIDAHLQDSS